jgi:hypothetical protein
MSFPNHLKKALDSRLKGQVRYMRDWTRVRTGAWKGSGALPVGLVLHHTAGAATDSTDPKHPGNRTGANNGVVNFVQNKYQVPAANFTLDRDGTVYVHSAFPVWHAGVGTFVGRPPWSSFGIPRDDANRWMLGVEVISKGRKKDFTQAQIDSLVQLIRACRDAAEWNHTGTKYLPRHRDWAPGRKVDIVYTNAEVQEWLTAQPEAAPKPEPVPQEPVVPTPGAFWDGRVPTYEAIIKAQDEGIANLAAHRLASRLADLGYFKGTPAPRYEQGYPRRAVRAYQEDKGFKVPTPGAYGPKLHQQLFGVKP